MSSPFPGMDPYLESPAFWSDFHASFITYWRDALIDCLPDHYEVRIEELHERHIEILHRPERTVVAILELLSPTNKEEPGRTLYLAKRNALAYHPVHLIELDLLVKGRRLPVEEELPAGDYYAMVSRGDRRPKCDVFAWTVRQALPAIPIPLLAPDPDVWFDIGGVFTTTYERGRYARSLNYDAAPPVTFEPAGQAWVMERAAMRR